MKKNKILIIFTHPAIHKSRINIRMIEFLKNLEDITFRNLYELYPDFHIDVKEEQKLLLEHDIIVWHHPFYWYSAPAMLKEWIDLVLEHGFAYGKEGTALKGKKVLSVITTGGRRDAYKNGGFNQYSMAEFLAPYHRTVTLCYMDYLPPYVVHGSHLMDQNQINEAAEDFKNMIMTLRDSDFRPGEFSKHDYLNDLLFIEKN
ncbi:MAG: NAD(P)H-dependent oxidoreductase [Bacteroidales bacterium]|nr:NAD(P)H-dependent oxidoreductase [Bacteroidales bacterium]